MPKITLISTDESIASMGIRTISSNLIKHGFDTAIVIMADYKDSYNEFQLDALLDVCRGSLFIGISSMTHGIKKAIEIKKILKKNFINIPIVIGGIHSTLNPESLLENFDFICLGEGEDLVVDLAKCLVSNMSPVNIPGLWCRSNSVIFKNSPIPLRMDLNDYPMPDYVLDHHYIFESGKIVSMELGHINCDYFPVMGSRGCPHECTYCSNHRIKEKYPWRKKVRQYSINYLIKHLSNLCRIYPTIKSFWLEDDTFFAKDINQIIQFADRYKEEVRKPFNILVSPWTYSEEKVRILVNAGMDRLIFGIQSGSENTNINIYNRSISNARLFSIINSLNSFKELLPFYDFIGMNPFETREDLVNSIKFIRQIPTPFFLFSNNLAFYPGTKISERAIKLGIDISRRDRHTDAKHGYAILKNEKIKHKLFHLILLLMGGRADKIRIGGIPRIFISNVALKMFCYLEKKHSWSVDKFAVILSLILARIDLKDFLKKHLNHKQIQNLKKAYSFIKIK
ncbi:MAG: radical SAM protein [Patescibacteria group bacterium]|jgi:radical SAM superfamily enzyme YgiQ (UPF0313 family)